jgi:hypothetical protein
VEFLLEAMLLSLPLMLAIFLREKVISHKYRGLCVAFLISKSVEPNEELKVG